MGLCENIRHTIEIQKPIVTIIEPHNKPWTWMKSKEKKNRIMEWAYPLAGECASLAHWQSTHGKFFMIRNPSDSQLWNTKPIRWLIKQESKLNLKWAEYSLTRPGTKDEQETTWILHNLPGDILAPLEDLEPIGIRISRERLKSAINSIIADC